MNNENFIVKEHQCIESVDNEIIDCDRNDSKPDRSDLWYILPIILDNKELCNNNNILHMSYLELNGLSLLTVAYKWKCKPIIDGADINKDMLYNDNKFKNYYQVTFKIPDDKRYLCNIISKTGSLAITSQLFNDCFKKVLV